MTHPANPEAAARSFVIRGARVWDGISERVDPQPQEIRIEHGRIVSIGGDASSDVEAEVWNAPSGAIAMPGLIDAHVHLTLDPSISSLPAQLSIPEPTVVAGSATRAEQMVRAGITTARDLGGGAWLEVALRDRIDVGELAGPRLLCAGQPLTPVGGHCHFWGGEVDGADSVRAVIERQLDKKVDWIKVMATGGVNTKGYSIREAQFDTDQLVAIREQAQSSGLPVAAHCHGTAGIRNAVAARVASIEHCSFAGKKGFGDDFDASLPGEMRRAGTWVSPTVNAGWQRFAESDDSRFYREVRHYLAALRDAGVRMVASTDAGIPNVAHHDLARALLVFARYADFSAVEVLRTATSHAAEALDLADETGSLRAGLAADLLVVPGDPTLDLAVLAQPALVVARGRRFYPA
jgi:imidazolonepropionase-like amidohydrolase